jgi:hypothetical protein
LDAVICHSRRVTRSLLSSAALRGGAVARLVCHGPRQLNAEAIQDVADSSIDARQRHAERYRDLRRGPAAEQHLEDLRILLI